MTSRVAIIACGSAKLDRVAPARELYTGSLFRAARGDVEARGLPWGIASAKYAWVNPDQLLAPYDATFPLRRIPGDESDPHAFWAADVAFGLMDLLRRLDPTAEPASGRRWRHWHGVVELHMGEAYAAPLRLAVPERFEGVRIEEPCAGMEIGYRLAFYKRRRSPPQLELFGVAA